VRARITAAVALMVVAAMLGTGVVLYLVESRRIEASVRAGIDQEFAEFRTLEGGTDPDTGKDFDSSSRLLQVFLERNLPGPNEVLVGWVGGPRWVGAGPHGTLTDDPAFRAAVPGLITTGADGVIRSEKYGEVRLSVQPIAVDGRQDDGLVVAVLMDEARGELDALLRTFSLVALLSLGLIVAVAWRVAGSLLAPIRGLNTATRRISATDLSARLPERGNDDLTDLTRTTNEMLDRLEAAFTAQRQFLDDAGHELKTPLTVLRGHLELLDASDPEELRETRDLLLDEVDRMSRLVQDLILLAKTRRPDFVVPAEVDLDQLTHTLLAKCQALGDRRWVLDGLAHETASIDEQRITQAVLQLADNAVKHTDAGAEIGIGSGVDAEEVRLWVRDTGDGISPEDREAVLERFARSHVRPGDDGFGLGLSIVSAIAHAHRGRVVIGDAPTSSGATTGAMVEVRLPRGGAPWPRS
jgi:signal transduction histidine kinase